MNADKFIKDIDHGNYATTRKNFASLRKFVFHLRLSAAKNVL